MKKFVWILLSLFLLYSCGEKEQVNQYMHPQAQIDFVKKQIKSQGEPYYTAYQNLIYYADSILNEPTHALVDFAVPGYYVKPKEHRENSLALNKDAFGAYCEALAYKLSGKKKYGIKSVAFLNAWANTNKKYSEFDGPLVMSYAGTGLLMAAELMGDCKIWKKAEKEVFAEWVKNVYQKATNEIRERSNNWADWGRFGSLLCASFLNDRVEIATNAALVKSDLFKKVLPDGHMPEETRREANGIWYTYFSLAPMTAACWIIYNATGENIFALEQDGASIKHSIDYLLYYAKNPEEWPWWEHPNKGNHKTWPDALLEAMYGIYGNEEYVDFVKDSRPHVYDSHHYAWAFPTLMPLSLNGYK